MLVEVFSDMKVFMAVFIITIFAFGQAFLLLSNNNAADDQFIAGGFAGCLLFAYNLALGAFDSSALGTVHYILAAILFFMSTLFLCVIMLNLLIAVISETYVRVQEAQMNTLYKTMCDLIDENRWLVPQSELDSLDAQGDYMYLAKVDESEISGEQWKRKMAMLTKTVERKVGGIESQLKALSEEITEKQKEAKAEFSSQFLKTSVRNHLAYKRTLAKIDAMVGPANRAPKALPVPRRPQNQLS